MFHDGSPAAILRSAAGRLRKAEVRHADAINAWSERVRDSGADHALTGKAAGTAQEARQAHQDAIQAAEEAVSAADSAHAAMLSEHRAVCTESRSKLTAFPVIGSPPPASGVGSDTAASPASAAAASGSPAV